MVDLEKRRGEGGEGERRGWGWVRSVEREVLLG